MTRKPRLSSEQTRSIINHFIAGTSALSTALLCGVSRRITTERYHLFRTVIFDNLKKNEPVLSGKIEVDESYFGGHRKGNRGRVQVEKLQYLAHTREMGMFIP